MRISLRNKIYGLALMAAILPVVKEMQSAVSSGVREMDKFSEEVRRRVAEVNSIAAALGKMIEKVQALGPEFETAKQGMKGQTQAAEQINEAMKQLRRAPS